MRIIALLALLFIAGVPVTSPAQSLSADIDKLTTAVEADLLTWRRHLHQNPELSNREVETAKYVAEKLRSFGLEPQTGMAKTGVIAVLTGGRAGPMVALGADVEIGRASSREM